MNKFVANGRLTKDIELRSTNSGKSVVSNSIAVRNDFKNSKGEYDSEFVNITVWNSTAEYLSKYAHKGDMVLIEGRLTTRSYDKTDGTKAYITEIVCEKVELIGNKKQDQETSTEENYENQHQENRGIQLSDEDIDKTFNIELPF